MNVSMDAECRDLDLVADVGGLIRQFNTGALSSFTMNTSHLSPSKRPVGRR
jgi:hypothetical protein